MHTVPAPIEAASCVDFPVSYQYHLSRLETELKASPDESILKKMQVLAASAKSISFESKRVAIPTEWSYTQFKKIYKAIQNDDGSHENPTKNIFLY